MKKRPIQAHRRNAATALSKVTVTAFALLLALSAAASFSGMGALSGTASASEPGSLATRFGVCEPHMKLHDPATMERELFEMEEAGIGWARVDFAWADLEPQRGEWTLTKMDMVIDKAEAHGIELLGILGAPPPWANGGKPFTYPPTDLEAWRNYVFSVCSRYRGRVAAWEIWNEENIGFWMPWPDANAYVSLVAQTSPVIRAADPGATVVMGGVAGLDPAYLDACLKAGIAEYVDTITYHPYTNALIFNNYQPLEAHCRYIVNWLRDLISKYTSKQLEIWLTEVGWTTCSPSPPGVDQATQAAYMTRTFINYAGLPVSRVIWYNLWDEWANPSDPEMNYGLLAHDFTRKPSLEAYRVFLQVFGESTPAGDGVATYSCSRPGSLEAHAFTLPDGGLVVSAWKADDLDDSLTLTLGSASYSEPVSIDWLTGWQQAASGVSKGADGKITVAGLQVGKQPAILKFSPVTEPRIAEVTPASGAAGSEAAISGAGFGASRGTSVVSFGGRAATEYTAWSSDLVRCRVPDIAPGALQLSVTTVGGTSNPTQFTVAPPGPAVSSVSPRSAAEGAQVGVEISGAGFAPGDAVTLARDGSTIAATSVNVVSSARITCSFNFQTGQAGSYDVVVRAPDGVEGRLSGGFTVSAAQCGAGGAPAVLVLGLAMGFLTVAGLGRAGGKFRGHDR